MIEALRPIAERIRARGGRAVVVGGFVRDRLLGIASKDVDVEVFGLSAAELERALAESGRVLAFGRAFGVMRVEGLDVDFALARGGALDFTEAARLRDLTINAIGLDPLTDEILDPLGGRRDLEARVLRAADARHFADDPLRGLRVMQLAARFGMAVDPALARLCGALDLAPLPGERVRIEFDKLLLRADRPSRGLAVLRETGMLRFFPELAALVGVPQDPVWHPEGDVWTHTALSVDAAAALRTRTPEDAALMYGVLCHDFGKPFASREAAGRISSHRHERAGAAIARGFLERLRAPEALVRQVEAIALHHLAPMQLPAAGASARAYRKLARALAAAQVSPALLERAARADHWGRTTDDARARRFAAGDRFLAEFAALAIPESGPRDVVLGRHLVARGFAPGPEFARILERCREVQDETGWSDPDAILSRALAPDAESGCS